MGESESWQTRQCRAAVAAPPSKAPVSRPHRVVDAESIRPIGLVRLSLLAVVVGIVTGFGAVLFRDLIGFIHNVLFLGKFAVAYDANLFTPASPWGALRHPGAGGRRADRDLPGHQLRARGARATACPR